MKREGERESACELRGGGGGPLQGKFQPITNQSKDIFNIDNDKNSVNLYRWAS